MAKRNDDRDRRVWQRCRFYSPVQVVHARGVMAPAPLAADISAGGIKLRGLRSVDLGEARLLIPLPPGVDERPHLFVNGRVVWRSGQAAGFAFSAVSEETRASLERLTSLLAGPT